MGRLTQLPSQPPGNNQLLSPSFWIPLFGEYYILSYQPSLVILDDWATPEVDALSALKLEQQFKVKKFVQEMDKEMFNVQCAFLIATGPLCGPHDCIENDSAPLYEEIKVAFEQVLCLLGSANTQLSILKRQRVLAVINRSRTNLVELPLPNAKSWLFGDDFPLLASKQAELSRGLIKKLAQTTGKSFSKDVVIVPSLKVDIEETPLTSINPLGIPTLLNFSQITNGLVQKMAFSSPLPGRDVSQTPRVHGVLENPNIGPLDSLNCFRLQYKFPQNSFSKVSTIYPNIGSGGTPNIPGSERVIAKRGHT